MDSMKTTRGQGHDAGGCPVGLTYDTMTHRTGPVQGRLCLLLVVLLAMAVGPPAAEAGGPQSPLGDGAVSARGTEPTPLAGLVVTYDRVSQTTLRRAMEKASIDGDPQVYQAVTTLSVEDPRFSDALRFGLIPERQNLPPDTWTACLEDEHGLDTLLAAARDKLDLMSSAEAGELLQRFESISACTGERLTLELLAEFFFVTGWYQRSLGQDAIMAFQHVLALAPDYPFPEGYPAGVPEDFRAAQSWLSSHDPEAIPVRFTGISGIDLYVDGVAVQEGWVDLSEGRHFLQWIDRRGKGLGGIFESLSKSDHRGPINWPGPRMRPETSDEAIARLENAIRDGSIEPALTNALVRIAREEGHPWILVILPATLRSPAKCLLIARSGRNRIDLVSRRDTDRSSRAAARAALGFGVATVVAGGAWAGSGYLIENHQFRRSWPAHTTEVVNRGSPFAFGAGLAGVIVSTSIYLWFPGKAESRHWEVRLLVPPPGTSLHHGAAGVQVGVRW